MRTLSLLLLVACTTTSSTNPTPAETDAGRTADSDAAGPRGGSRADKIARAIADMPAAPTPTSKLWVDERYPPQGAPEPVDIELATLSSWDGTTWSLRDGRTLTVSADQAILGEQTLPVTLTPSGGTVGDLPVRLVTPCAAALFEDGFWEPMARTEPACTPDEAATTPSSHVTWRFASKDHYVLLPGGRAWRHGPKRVFMRPIGTWSTTGDGPTVSFGPTTFTGHTVDPCHTAFASSVNDGVYRASRDFPACPDALKTYTGLPWTMWRGPGGDLLDLRAPGTAKLDQYTRRELHDGTWQPTEDGLEVSFPGVLSATLVVEGCTATATDADGTTRAFSRTWPPCAPEASAGTP